MTENDRFLPRREVERLTGYRKSALYALMSRGEFPKSRAIGPNRVVWLESEVRAWMADRLAA